MSAVNARLHAENTAVAGIKAKHITIKRLVLVAAKPSAFTKNIQINVRTEAKKKPKTPKQPD